MPKKQQVVGEVAVKGTTPLGSGAVVWLRKGSCHCSATQLPAKGMTTKPWWLPNHLGGFDMQLWAADGHNVASGRLSPRQ